MNGGVVLVISVVCAGLAVAGAVALAVRRLTVERRAGGYQQTLDTLRKVGATRGAPTPRVATAEPHLHLAGSAAGAQAVPGAGPPPGGGGSVAVEPASGQAPVPVDGGSAMVEPVVGDEHPGPDPTPAGGPADDHEPEGDGHAADGDPAPTRVFRRPLLVFGDDVPSAAPPADRGAGPQPPPGYQLQPAGQRRRAPRPLRLATTAAGVLLVAAVTATVVAVSRGGSGSGTTGGAASSTASRSSATGGAARGKGGIPAKRKRSVPATLVVVPAAGSPYRGTVAVPASYQVKVEVTDTCWVQGQQAASGSQIWAGVLDAGQGHTFAVTGSMLLEIGAADASLTVDGRPLALPQGYQVPYDLTFEPG